MAQFDVYLNPLEDLRDSHPFVIEIQSKLLKRPVALIVIPLARLAQGSEKVFAGSTHPASFFGGLCVAGHFPISRKTTEMVQPDDIHQT